jgi:hypothetical protein
MRSAETVLSIIRERGKQGLPLEDIYRQLYNPNLYLIASVRLYAHTGAMTPGSTTETVDGMSRAKIEHLIDDLRHERYRWTRGRRTCIAKKNGKLRGLGLPAWSDKLLQARPTPHSGGILRTAIQPPFTWLPSWARMSYGSHGHTRRLERNQMVYRGRYFPLLRHHRSYGVSRHTGRKAQGQPFLEVAIQPAQSRLSGGVEISPNPLRKPTGRGGFSNSLTYLSGQV